MSSAVLDLFKVCKVADLKDVDKKGQVRYTHEKALGRKVIAIEGNVSAANYLKFPGGRPKQPFAHRYLYLQCVSEPGHIFCLVLTLHSNARAYKLHLSTLHKAPKQSAANTLCLPVPEPPSKWSVLVLDLHELCSELISPNEIRLSFELAEVELRATMRVKGAFMSDSFYSPEDLPKELALPLWNGELFFQKYGYIVLGQASQNHDRSNLPDQPGNPHRNPDFPRNRGLDKKQVLKSPEPVVNEKVQQPERSRSFQNK